MPFNNLIFKLNQTPYYHPEIVLWSPLSCCQEVTEFIWAEIRCHKLSWKNTFHVLSPYRTHTGWFLTLCKQVYIKHTRFSGQNSGLWSLVCFPVPILWTRPLKMSLPISCDKAKNLQFLLLNLFPESANG